MKNLYSSDAFTGLEAAIVLIAFVVVAAVFWLWCRVLYHPQLPSPPSTRE